MNTPRKKRDGLDYLHDKYFRTPEARAELEAAQQSATVARTIYELRTKAGLTQRELARLVGTTHTAISRLESDDYEGHSLAMLRRIAAVLGHRLEVRFVSSANGSEATDGLREKGIRSSKRPHPHRGGQR